LNVEWEKMNKKFLIKEIEYGIKGDRRLEAEY